MSDQQPWDNPPQGTPEGDPQGTPEGPRPPGMPDGSEQEMRDADPPASATPEEAQAFRDWQNRLGPKHLPGSPTSQGNFLYLGSELRRPRKNPPPSS